MLTFLRWLWGCWHDWEPWSDYHGLKMVAQRRDCKKCGKRVLRFVEEPI